MFKYTKHSLKKIESIFESVSYQIRYEKGSFNSGYCLVEAQQIIVINRFFDVEGRINTLLDILSKIDIDESSLDEKQAEFLATLQSRELSQST